MKPAQWQRLARFDAFCGRLNSGLAAVAVVLAVAVAITAAGRSENYLTTVGNYEQVLDFAALTVPPDYN